MTTFTDTNQNILITLNLDHLNDLKTLHAEIFPQSWSAHEFASLISSPNVFGIAAYSSDYMKHRQKTYYRVKKNNRAMKGFILGRLSADEAEILTFGVAKYQRRYGIGQTILQAALSHIHQCGGRKVFLEVAEDNVAALTLYRNNDFSPVGKRQGYYIKKDETPSAALIMRCDLQ